MSLNCTCWYKMHSCARFAMVLMSLLPPVLIVILLWNFNALNEGMPLLVVLSVPALGWCIAHLFKIFKNPRKGLQGVLDLDPPPKYEKVMQEPPPYESLNLGKGELSLQTTSFAISLSDVSAPHRQSQSQTPKPDFSSSLKQSELQAPTAYSSNYTHKHSELHLQIDSHTNSHEYSESQTPVGYSSHVPKHGESDIPTVCAFGSHLQTDSQTPRVNFCGSSDKLSELQAPTAYPSSSSHKPDESHLQIPNPYISHKQSELNTPSAYSSGCLEHSESYAPAPCPHSSDKHCESCAPAAYTVDSHKHSESHIPATSYSSSPHERSQSNTSVDYSSSPYNQSQVNTSTDYSSCSHKQSESQIPLIYSTNSSHKLVTYPSYSSHDPRDSQSALASSCNCLHDPSHSDTGET